VVRPRSCRVIYYFDIPALEIRYQLFDRVSAYSKSSKYKFFLRIKKRKEKKRRKRQGIVGPHKSDPFNKGLCVGLQR